MPWLETPASPGQARAWTGSVSPVVVTALAVSALCGDMMHISWRGHPAKCKHKHKLEYSWPIKILHRPQRDVWRKFSVSSIVCLWLCHCMAHGARVSQPVWTISMLSVHSSWDSRVCTLTITSRSGLRSLWVYWSYFHSVIQLFRESGNCDNKKSFMSRRSVYFII